jgi:hypothetical protein
MELEYWSYWYETDDGWVKLCITKGVLDVYVDQGGKFHLVEPLVELYVKG